LRRLFNQIDLNNDFVQMVRKKSAQPIELCYQCQKCAAGCPMGELGEYSPHQILRLVQFGMKERVLKSSAIWLCLSCETCSARCPNQIGIPEIMDVLREMAFREGIVSGEKRTPIFHHLFLNSVKKRGRVHEAILMLEYKLKSRDLFSDLEIGLKMFQKGKLPLLTPAVEDKKAMHRIFTRITGLKNNNEGERHS